jgi:hypothetical protein
MAARIPGAEFRMIVGSGHICPFEAPEQTTAVLEGFLNQNPDFQEEPKWTCCNCASGATPKKMDPTGRPRSCQPDSRSHPLAPTSSGLQPFQVLVITDPDLRAWLRPLAKSSPDC